MSAREAPINRDITDAAAPWLRLLLGVAFVAYSANTTIQYGADDLAFFFKAGLDFTIGYVADRYWYASLFAVILFLGEVVCGERWPRIYWLFLIPDAFYTSRQIQQGFQNAFTVILSGGSANPSGAAIAGAIVASWVAGLLIGFIIAKWGEVLIFGRRRGPRRRKEE
jgi:hypothetical protein